MQLRSSIGREGCFSAISDGLCPGKTPSLRGDSRAISPSHESPRSGVNVSGLRPSLIAKHSLRSSSRTLFTSARREGCFSVINDGRSPGKTPSLGGDSRAISSFHESPRSGVNVSALRPSLIAKHSLRSSSRTLFTSARREGCFSVINDGRSPGKTPSLGGDSRAIYSSRESPRSGVNVSGLRPSLIAKHSLRSSLGIPLSPAQGEGRFSAISDGRSPGKTPSLRGDSRAIYSSHESPRSGVNVFGLRPSLIAKHSLRGALGIPLSSARREGCFSVMNDGRSPGKTPSLRGDSRAMISSHESPRSGVNVTGLRPSLITKHSLRSALGILLSPAPGEGCFSAISDGRSPGKTPSLRGDSRGKSSNQGARHG